MKIKHLTESLNKKYLLKEKINPNFNYNEFLKLAEFLKMKTSVKALITALYPDDDLCQEIYDDITFGDVKKALDNGTDIYDVIGVDDSVIREYVFKTLADILNVSYDDIYSLWMYGYKNEELDEEYSLVGQDGNAFSLMGYTARCMKECGLRDEIDEMRERAMSGDYNNLIAVCDEYVQRCNEIDSNLEENIGYDYVDAKSLKESKYSNVIIGLYGDASAFETEDEFENFLNKCKKAGIAFKNASFEYDDWEVELIGDGAAIYKIASYLPGYNNTEMYNSPDEWIDNYRIDDMYESFNLKEGKWSYTLKNGEKLRQAIRVCSDHDEPNNEDYADVLKAIYACYKELKDKEIIDEDDFDRYTEDFDLYLYDNFQDWDDPEEVINYELNDLYDLCDNLNVWISLSESLNESADSVWVIIPTENRYDDNLDIMKFAKKYGVYNSKKEVYDKIDELSSDRYDAFIPYEIMTESLNEANKAYKKCPRKRIDFEDDIVIVYDDNDKIMYKGLEDYEPMKYENWEWDEETKSYVLGKYRKICLDS